MSTHDTAAASKSTRRGAQASSRLVLGRYRLLRRGGHGGFGTVYQAEDSALGNRLVAVKLLRLARFFRERRAITSLAWCPDGEHFAVGLQDHTLLLFSLGAQVPSHLFRGHQSAVTALAWSPDGRFLASQEAEGEVCVWEAQSRRLRLSYHEHRGRGTALAWSPDGAYLASGDVGGSLHVWEATSGRNVWQVAEHTGSVLSVRWLGAYVASAGKDGTAQLREGSTGALSLVYRYGSDHLYDALCVAGWSPDGAMLAARGSGTLSLWEAPGNQHEMPKKAKR